MKKLPEGTCGFVRETDYDFNYRCEICAAKLEQQGRAGSNASRADYEFTADTGEHIFLCADCYQNAFDQL
jgi:hypothetical protein